MEAGRRKRVKVRTNSCLRSFFRLVQPQVSTYLYMDRDRIMLLTWNLRTCIRDVQSWAHSGLVKPGLYHKS